MTAAEVLDKVKKMVTGVKEEMHGGKKENHQRIADLWNCYIRQKAYVDPDLAPADVAVMMVLLKIARSTYGGQNIDDGLDMTGYAAIFTELNYHTEEPTHDSDQVAS